MRLSSSTISLNEMRFFAHHGVTEQERLLGCYYVVDVHLAVDCSAAALSDNLEDTLNYAEVYEVVSREMQISSKLIEHVAGRIARSLLDCFPEVSSLRIRLSKINPPMGADVHSASVELAYER